MRRPLVRHLSEGGGGDVPRRQSIKPDEDVVGGSWASCSRDYRRHQSSCDLLKVPGAGLRGRLSPEPRITVTGIFSNRWVSRTSRLRVLKNFNSIRWFKFWKGAVQVTRQHVVDIGIRGWPFAYFVYHGRAKKHDFCWHGVGRCKKWTKMCGRETWTAPKPLLISYRDSSIMQMVNFIVEWSLKGIVVFCRSMQG